MSKRNISVNFYSVRKLNVGVYTARITSQIVHLFSKVKSVAFNGTQLNSILYIDGQPRYRFRNSGLTRDDILSAIISTFNRTYKIMNAAPKKPPSSRVHQIKHQQPTAERPKTLRLTGAANGVVTTDVASDTAIASSDAATGAAAPAAADTDKIAKILSV